MELAKEAKPKEAKRKRVETKQKTYVKTYVSRWFESNIGVLTERPREGMMQMGDTIITNRCSVRIFSVSTANVWQYLGGAPKKAGKTFVIEIKGVNELLDMVIQSSSFAEGVKRARVALALKMDTATIDYIEMFGVKDVCDF